RDLSGWISPNQEYETAVHDFIADALNLERSAAFLGAFRSFANRVAAAGMQKSLSQLVLKLMSPGVADIYQGCELWNLSFMDPDNRRLVDYGARVKRLSEIRNRLADEREPAMTEWFANWRDGSIKMALLAVLLDLRREMAELFATGSYEPV